MKDRFSDQAPQYAAFRPRYPKELYAFIFSHVRKFEQAWDAGTGNGQAAVVLAEKFKHVLATDISQKQMDHAARRDNITYEVSGELCSLDDREVNLVTVAQAIHWFDRPKFYAEVERVAAPGAAVALWCYGLLTISPEIDTIIWNFYKNVVGPCWDPERRLIDEKLQTIEFPFDEIKAPPFSMKFNWRLEELDGYLNTWSATQKYIKVHRNNPVNKLMELVQELEIGGKVSVEFPIYLRIGRK